MMYATYSCLIYDINLGCQMITAFNEINHGATVFGFD